MPELIFVASILLTVVMFAAQLQLFAIKRLVEDIRDLVVKEKVRGTR